MNSDIDTIFALSSGGLPSGVAVIRVSGPLALDVAAQLVTTLPAPQQAAVRTIRMRNGLVLDQGLILTFHRPASFTGEDCVEFQIHGGKALVSALLDELSTFKGCRLAEHGEFSRRALENGKLDLVEIEGLADLLAAETEMQRRLAVEQSSGGHSRLYRAWADRITHARALIEAELDFADEEDVPGSVSDRVWADMALVLSELETYLAGAAFGEIIRDGLKVVIAGPPNSGKSSLMNALAERDVAIVTNIAGTTRDILQVDLDIDGFAVKLFDTAGLRETEEVVEVEGIRRALKKIEDADIVLSLAEVGERAEERFPDFSGSVVRIGTKVDLPLDDLCHYEYDLQLSSKTGAGLAELRGWLAKELHRLESGYSLALPSRLRHRQLIEHAAKMLYAAVGDGRSALEVRAEFLRLAADSLGRITGHVDVEDLLEIIFSEFCIGK
jgi:tRNA modification GTPase